MNKQLSLAGGSFIRGWEKYMRLPYQDSVGYWTWGFGHKRVGNEPIPQFITAVDALALWKRDMAPFVAMANKALTHECSQNQFDMFISILENTGPGVPGTKDGVILLKNGKQSSLLRYMNQGAFDLAAAEFPKWDHAGGKEVRGLYNRRMAERAIFQTPDGVPYAESH